MQMWKFALSNFNSIKVRLKLAVVKQVTIALAFQFHKGTIKTFEAAGINPYFALFQFHKGTIKT